MSTAALRSHWQHLTTTFILSLSWQTTHMPDIAAVANDSKDLELAA